VIGRHFEDFAVGDRFETAGKTFSESEIMDFAFQYDPQRFHIDVEAAKDTIYGGLIASGIQTLAVTLRMVMQTGIYEDTGLGSSGIDGLKWFKPVYPGDTLHGVVEVLETRTSGSKPDRGYVTARTDALNQNDEKVMTFICMQIIKRRD
jgi:acyl dehydratase